MTSNSSQPIDHGLRVFTCGHSFHVWVAELVAEIAASAGIHDHIVAGTSGIGGSRAIQHWDVPEAENEARRTLYAGSVDVLTLSCMSGPDDGIRKFAELAVEHNPDIRVTVQELWLPEDRFPFDPLNRTRTSPEEYNQGTLSELTVAHDAYFAVMDEYIRALNAELGRPVVFVVPDGQATLLLRERIMAGTVPGVAEQSDLFTDAWGHPAPPLKALAGYCHFSTIYRQDPRGLPRLSILADNPGWDDALNSLLQELAWEAVTRHPLAGVKANP